MIRSAPRQPSQVSAKSADCEALGDVLELSHYAQSIMAMDDQCRSIANR